MVCNICRDLSRAPAGKGVIEHMKQAGVCERHIAYVVHAAALQEAEKVREMLSQAFAGLEIHIMDLSPVFVTQGGPGCIAIQYIER